jgi:WXXGXW repeat (2 copies)
MSKKTALILGTAPIAALVLAGCGTTREVVTPVPVATAAPATVIVASTTPPPAPRVEVRPPSPGVDYTWQRGYWVLVNGQYEWVPGHWEGKVIN